MGEVIKFPNIKTEEEAREASDKMIDSFHKDQKEAVDKLLNSDIASAQVGYSSIEALLDLDDEQFALIAPIFLDEFYKSANNPNDRILLAQALNASGYSLENLHEDLSMLLEAIDSAELGISKQKRDFLKELSIMTYNIAMETQGVPKKVVSVPIEYCREGAKEPKYMTDGSAGLDIYSPDEYDIKPGETIVIKTGLKVAIPNGYALLIHPRSGLSYKSGLRVPNSIGLIDSDYRDEIGVMLQNTEPVIKEISVDEDGKVKNIVYGSSYHIGKGERIAQFRLVEVPKIAFYKVDSVSEIGENRGGGFGSTGEK